MAKRVLSVGQCVPDGTAIKSFLTQRFAATVQASDSADDALAMLHNGPFDLVLVNRNFVADGGSGLDFIKAVKATPATGKIPIMLVSNFADAQQRAIDLGAEPGFGKAQIGSEQVVEQLTPFLAENDESGSS
jgi:two-component system chemotaxis response regulator CheY